MAPPGTPQAAGQIAHREDSAAVSSPCLAAMREVNFEQVVIRVGVLRLGFEGRGFSRANQR